MSAVPWSTKGEKTTTVADDEFMIIDSEDSDPSTTNKRVKKSTINASIKTEVLEFSDESTLFTGDLNGTLFHASTGIETAVFDPGGTTEPWGIYFKPDGKRFWYADEVTGRIRQFDMTIPWDIANASESAN